MVSPLSKLLEHVLEVFDGTEHACERQAEAALQRTPNIFARYDADLFEVRGLLPGSHFLRECGSYLQLCVCESVDDEALFWCMSRLAAPGSTAGL
eukprot:scaffold1243_cov403-Prasinococcus_capsulatus_cf.AAC.31